MLMSNNNSNNNKCTAGAEAGVVSGCSSTALLKEKVHNQIESQNQKLLEKLYFDIDHNTEEESHLVDNNHKLIKSGSSFDKLLLFRWLMAMDIGAFKFKIEKQVPTRYLDGKFNFLCQINAKRITEKRPTELKKSSINVDFDPKKFNFTKINENEILFKLANNKCCLGENPVTKDIQQYVSHSSSSSSSDGGVGATQNINDNLIIINNSPIELGHILLVPQMMACNRQVLNMDAIRLAIDISFLTNSNGLFVGFNSINAFASVNHLHLHAYYFGNKVMTTQDELQRFPIPIQNVNKATILTDKLWFIDENSYYFPAFAVQLCDFSNDCEEFAKKAILITDYFNKSEIPHNVVIVKCRPFRPCESSDDHQVLKTSTLSTPNITKTTIRIHIWPRKSSFDIAPNERQISFAICEMAGHFLLKDQKSLDEITEEEIVALSRETKLEEADLDSLKSKITNLFRSSFHYERA